ncbi:MAG: hypothetical protein ACJ719_14325 [Nitrososphaeraceae archaeon]|jgi:hypothetical protein
MNKANTVMVAILVALATTTTGLVTALSMMSQIAVAAGSGGPIAITDPLGHTVRCGQGGGSGVGGGGSGGGFCGFTTDSQGQVQDLHGGHGGGVGQGGGNIGGSGAICTGPNQSTEVQQTGTCSNK